MIVTKSAKNLRPGDVFSTDGYIVESAVILQGGGYADEIAVQVSLNGHQKFAYLEPNHPCPIWVGAL